MLVNPHNYIYRIGSIATLTCICEDGSIDSLDPMPVTGRTIRVKIRRHSDNLYLDFETGAWGDGSGDSFEQLMTDNNDGTYYWSFNQGTHDTGEEEDYTVIYTDKGETYDGTVQWGGADYEILSFQEESFSPLDTSDPLKVNVWGTLMDENGDPVSGASVTALINKDGVYFLPNGSTIDRTLITTTTDANGYWDLELLPTELMSYEAQWMITINKKKPTYLINVPQTPSKIALNDLVPTPNVFTV